MKRSLRVILLFAIASIAACHKTEASASDPVARKAPARTAAAPAVNPVAPTANAEDLAGLAQGALVVKEPESIEEAHRAIFMLDEDPATRWSSPEGKGTNQVTVIELAERSSIERVQFDEEQIELDSRSPKNVLVELSDTSADAGFKPIANVTLAAQNRDGQSFPADAKVSGKWLRMTVVSNYGGALTDLPEFRAFGKKLTNTALPSVTGTYRSGEQTIRLTQKGAALSGCYDGGTAPLSGGIDGRVARYTYQTDVDSGPAVLVFSSDAKRLVGGWWKTNGASEHPAMNVFEATRVSDDPGKCPGPSPKDEIATALEDEKRLRLYGINFDSDSDHLRSESKPTLDLVAEVLKQHADWKVTIEGHTDSTSTPEHNQKLSESRAAAVKSYLAGAGVDAARLATAGLGATKPVAPNETAVGRAANRRVELARD